MNASLSGFILFPARYGDDEEVESVMLGESTVETVCLLGNRNIKPDAYVDLSLDMEDYHRIIGDKP